LVAGGTKSVKKAFMATKNRQHFQTSKISTRSLQRPQAAPASLSSYQ